MSIFIDMIKNMSACQQALQCVEGSAESKVNALLMLAVMRESLRTGESPEVATKALAVHLEKNTAQIEKMMSDYLNFCRELKG